MLVLREHGALFIFTHLKRQELLLDRPFSKTSKQANVPKEKEGAFFIFEIL